MFRTGAPENLAQINQPALFKDFMDNMIFANYSQIIEMYLPKLNFQSDSNACFSNPAND